MKPTSSRRRRSGIWALLKSGVEASQCQKCSRHWMVWGTQALDNIEMMPLRIFDQTDSGAKPRPDIGEKRALADEFRMLGGADPARQVDVRQRFVQSRALRE